MGRPGPGRRRRPRRQRTETERRDFDRDDWDEGGTIVFIERSEPNGRIAAGHPRRRPRGAWRLPGGAWARLRGGAGEVVGFLEPNGAGKTTTLRMLTGFLPATDGEAVIAGHDIFGEPALARPRSEYLPETPPLYPEMTPAAT